MAKKTTSEKEKIREQKAKRRTERELQRIDRSLHPSRAKKWVLDTLIIAIASILYSYAVHAFTVPNNIAPGGVTGIATIINYLFDIPVGLMYGLINLPLIIIGFVFLGKNMMFKTLVSVGVITVATDYLFINLPVYSGDTMLAAIFSGVLMGAGLGLSYVRDATSGGTDIITRIIRKKVPHISLGKIMVAIDVVIVGGSMFVFQNIDSGLYAIISIVIASKIIDLMLYGMLEGKLLLIFSDHYSVIASRIISEQDRGVTILKGYGGYSGKEKNVICCAVHKNQYAKIKKIVSLADPNAFIVISNAGEVLGEGFSENKIV